MVLSWGTSEYCIDSTLNTLEISRSDNMLYKCSLIIY